MAKYVMAMTGAEAQESCGTEQLCMGLEARIEGGIHVVQLLWKQHAQEKYWRFLLIGTRNAFNEENLTANMWEVRHKWPSGALFIFNYYCHWTTLVVSLGEGTGHFLRIK